MILFYDVKFYLVYLGHTIFSLRLVTHGAWLRSVFECIQMALLLRGQRRTSPGEVVQKYRSENQSQCRLA